MTVVGLRFESIQFFVEDDIDHAGDGVGPVNGGRATRDHFSSCHQHRGDQRDVDAAAGGRRHDALGIDHGQRARAEERVQTAQIRELCAHVEITQADVIGGEEIGVLRQFAQYLADVGQGEIFNVLGVQHGNWIRRGEGRARDTRTGDDDLVESRILAVLREWRSLLCRCELGCAQYPRECSYPHRSQPNTSKRQTTRTGQ